MLKANASSLSPDIYQQELDAYVLNVFIVSSSLSVMISFNFFLEFLGFAFDFW